jgi:hypothetical protein
MSRSVQFLVIVETNRALTQAVSCALTPSSSHNCWEADRLTGGDMGVASGPGFPKLVQDLRYDGGQCGFFDHNSEAAIAHSSCAPPCQTAGVPSRPRR